MLNSISIALQYLEPLKWNQIELFVLDSNTWNRLTICKQMNSISVRFLPTKY